MVAANPLREQHGDEMFFITDIDGHDENTIVSFKVVMTKYTRFVLFNKILTHSVLASICQHLRQLQPRLNNKDIFPSPSHNVWTHFHLNAEAEQYSALAYRRLFLL
jgi:hypothetical protein